MNKSRLKYLFILLAVSGCSRPELKSELGTVFGKDDRQIMPLKGLPYQAIGILSIRKTKICTATLISPKHILSSAHCLATHRPQKTSEVTFHLGFKNGKQIAASRVTKIFSGTEFPWQNREQDWSILELKTPLGNRFGHLNLISTTTEAMRNMRVLIAGYASDFLKKHRAPFKQNNCYIKFSYNGLLRHDCDVESGSSGAPLIVRLTDGRYYIVGIHVTSSKCRDNKSGQFRRCPKGTKYKHDIANYGVAAKNFSIDYSRLRLGVASSSQIWNPRKLR